MTSPAVAAPSIDEYLNTSEWDGFELEDGIPVEVPMSIESAWIGGQVSFHLQMAANSDGGIVLPQDTPIHCWPDRPRHFRKPDAMYFAPGQLPTPWPPLAEIAPAIAVEVISANEPAGHVDTKNREYLDAGVRLLWVIYPDTGFVYVFRADGSVSYPGPDGTLTGEDVLPSFSVPVRDLFVAE
jgi:Uma2 family endonuclease